MQGAIWAIIQLIRDFQLIIQLEIVQQNWTKLEWESMWAQPTESWMQHNEAKNWLNVSKQQVGYLTRKYMNWSKNYYIYVNILDNQINYKTEPFEILI